MIFIVESMRRETNEKNNSCSYVYDVFVVYRESDSKGS